MATVRSIYGASVTLKLDVTADTDHPNKMKFRGVLVRLDEASSRPPNGAEGHRIYVPSEVAEKRLKTLIGMGVNYAPGLNAHEQTRKVGVIEKAWIDGKDLCVSGIIWKHDFPEAKRDLKKDKLGMSMEIGEVHVCDVSASVWELSDFYFLGATILFQDVAAYHRTHLIAAKADEGAITTMTKKTAAPPRVSAADAAIARIAASQDKIISLLNQQGKDLADVTIRLDNIEIGAAGYSSGTGGVDKPDMTSAKKKEDEDDEDDMDAKMSKDEETSGPLPAVAGAKDDEDDECDDKEADDMETVSSDVEKGDLEELGSKLEEDEDDDDNPGHFNRGSKNKGRQTEVEDKLGKTVSSSRILNLTKHISRLQSQLAASEAANAKLARKMTRIDSQIAAASSQTSRRSYNPEIVGLLAKSNLDAREISASGQKLTPQEVDAVFAASGLNLDPVKRMALKGEFVRHGLMDEGAMDRGFGPR